MKMGNKNMGDLSAPDLVIDHLNLGAFSTIHKKVLTIQRYYLAGRMPVESRYSRIISKNCYCEHFEGWDWESKLMKKDETEGDNRET